MWGGGVHERNGNAGDRQINTTEDDGTANRNIDIVDHAREVGKPQDGDGHDHGQ